MKVPTNNPPVIVCTSYLKRTMGPVIADEGAKAVAITEYFTHEQWGEYTRQKSVPDSKTDDSSLDPVMVILETWRHHAGTGLDHLLDIARVLKTKEYK